jgi:CRP/FNR family transcriptional regulator, anaerobic regulatory protein
MGSEHQFVHLEQTESARCNRCALHALCLPGIVGAMNSSLGPVVADDITTPKGQFLYTSGDRATNLFVVKSGAFKIMTPLCGQDAHVSGFRLPGDLVGACGLTCGQYAFTAQALDRSTVCRLPMDRLRDATLRQPMLIQGLMQALSNQAAQAQRQITRTNLPALARFAIFIKDLSGHHKKRSLSAKEFELPMPRTDIADFLALAPETISRLIATLTGKGILSIEGKTVHIHDMDALETACESLS